MDTEAVFFPSYFRRAQEMLFQLEGKGNELAEAIAYHKRNPMLGILILVFYFKYGVATV